MRLLLKTLLATVAVVLAAPAFAEDYTEPQTKTKPSDRGIEFQALGGVADFTRQAGDILPPGPAYGAALTFEPVSLVGLELAYQGSTFKTDSDLPGAQSRVNQNSGTALIKLSPRFGVAEPYAFGGVGMSILTATGADTRFVQDDTAFSVPVGAGIDFHVPGYANNSLMLGARGTYVFDYNSNAFPTITESRGDWLQVTGNIGAQF
jgi:opacity protein-like surface antigen